MKAAVLDRHVLAVLQVEKNLEKLKKSSELLELIQKGEKTILYYLVVMSQVHEEIYHTKYYTDIKLYTQRLSRFLCKIFDFYRRISTFHSLDQQKELIH
ncbi:uncharacterized protein LOC143242175 isoform X2 [Tachypleus tridentatus]|uniref:uncharacterized protein LOC143242175 isoform X2 n=1 Tax=Tachypleus tridentatus TaxID=6853 RepID=UPI003FD38AF1